MGVDFLLRNAKKIALFAVFIGLIAAAIATVLDFIGTQVVAVLNGLSLGFVPMFAPSNLGTCLGIVIAVKTAGTAYEMSMQLIKWKVDILA